MKAAFPVTGLFCSVALVVDEYCDQFFSGMQIGLRLFAWPRICELARTGVAEHNLNDERAMR